MHRKTVTILLWIRARGHFVMSITKTHESHYVGVLDNPRDGRITTKQIVFVQPCTLKLPWIYPRHGRGRRIQLALVQPCTWKFPWIYK